VECLKRYRWNINSRTGEAVSPLHDAFSHGCLDGDTLIETRRGLVPIRDVIVGDYALTPAGYALVTASGATKVATEIIEIVTSDGVRLLATPEHKIFTTRGIVLADALRYTDSILTMQSAPCLSSQSIESAGYRDAVLESFRAKGIGFGLVAAYMLAKSVARCAYCILRFTAPCMASQLQGRKFVQSMAICATPVQKIGLFSGQFGNESIGCKSLMESGSIGSQRATTRLTIKSTAASLCIDTFGPSKTALFLMGFISTISTVIRQTMRFAILSCLPHRNTVCITQPTTSGLVVKQTASRFLKLANSLKHGTLVQWALNGIRNMPPMLGLIGSGTASPANNAAKSISRRSRQDQNSVTQIAKLRRLGSAEASRLVYDLTVEKHHCYLANGLLVSNSDAFRYLALTEALMSNGDWGGSLNYPKSNNA
jgi:hypothetical protein